MTFHDNLIVLPFLFQSFVSLDLHSLENCKRFDQSCQDYTVYSIKLIPYVKYLISHRLLLPNYDFPLLHIAIIISILVASYNVNFYSLMTINRTYHICNMFMGGNIYRMDDVQCDQFVHSAI